MKKRSSDIRHYQLVLSDPSPILWRCQEMESLQWTLP
jgi:hypothetical protein